MIRAVLQRRNGMGLMVEDVENWMSGAGPAYRNLLSNVAAQQAAVNVFETFARAKGVYDGIVGDGDYGRKCETAWQALLPHATGPTTTEMLEGLDALSAAAFRPVELRFALAIARDKYLGTRGVMQTEPDPAASREQFDLVNGSRAWDATAERAGEIAIDTTSSSSMSDDGIDDTNVTDVGTTDTTTVVANLDAAAAAAAAALRAQQSPKRPWLVPVLVACGVVALGGGAIWWARRHPSRRMLRTRRAA